MEASVEALFEEHDGMSRLVDVTLRDSQTTITDFKSFKKAFKEAWTHTPNAQNLFNQIGGDDEALKKIFMRPEIQSEVTRQGEDGAVERLLALHPDWNRDHAKRLYLMQRRETIIRGDITPESQMELPRLVAAPETAQASARMSQATRQGGRVYQRAKPQPFTEPEIRFLRNHPDSRRAELTAQFNILFNQRRTQQSIYFKRYRLLRE